MDERPRDDLLDDLRRLTRVAGRPLRAKDLPFALLLALRAYFGSLDPARRAAGLAPLVRKQRWSRDAVLHEVRRLSRQGVVITTGGLTRAGRTDVRVAIQKYIGSIVRARQLAGVPEPRRIRQPGEPWDDERVLDEIRTRHAGGEPLAHSKVPGGLLSAAQRYFGSWRAAVEATGLDYAQVRLLRAAYTRGEMVRLLRKLAASRPDMTAAELKRHRYSDAMVRLFGSVKRALARAGLSRWPRRVFQQRLSRREVIAALKARHRSGKSVACKAVESEDGNLVYSATIHFGRWTRVLAAAGLEREAGRWTREILLDALRARQARGLSLRPIDVMRADPRLYTAAQSRFLSYVRAVREIGAPAPWARAPWTADRVVSELRRKAGRRHRVMVAQAGARLASACTRYFGSFSAACRAAGLAVNGPLSRANAGRGGRRPH